MAKPKRTRSIRINASDTELERYHALATSLETTMAELIRFLLNDACRSRGIPLNDNSLPIRGTSPFHSL